MRIFRTRLFAKWAAKEQIADADLRKAVQEIEKGLVDANLGGSVYKKRIGVRGQGKRGGVRTLLTFKQQERAFFIYGFAKNRRDNISDQELSGLKRLASELLNANADQLEVALKLGKLHEIESDG